MSGTITFPTNPTLGQLFTVGTTTWQWNGTQWVNATTGQNFLPLAGGVMTSPGTIGGATLIQPAAIVGVTNGSNAAAGQVGEYLTASSGTPVPFPSGSVAITIVSLALTPGDWDIDGDAIVAATGGGAFAGSQSWVSLSNTDAVQGYAPGIQSSLTVGGVAAFTSQVLRTQLMRVNSAAAFTAYLRAYIYSITSPGPFSGQGSIYARRMR